MAGRIQTVLGPIEPEELGITLSHEHIVIDGSSWFIEPPEASEKHLAYQPVSLENLWWVRYHWFQNLDDVRHLSEEEAVTELSHFRMAGGGTVVDMSPGDLGRDPMALARISRATGLHIVMGSGHYLAMSMRPGFESVEEGKVLEEIVRDITIGVGDTGIKAGVIGEIACSAEMDPREIKSLRAAAKAQQITGANLHIHPDPTVFRTVEVIEAAGADPSRTTIAHIDVRRLLGFDDRLRLLSKGYTLEYDSFGREGYYPLYLRTARTSNECVDLPNDHQRINELIEMVRAGFGSQLLISQDIWNKHHCRKYGGFGYDHILRNALPVMRAKGLTDDEMRAILIDNPKRVLAFA
jgi:phosphotriesterase-related protein